MTFTEFRCLVSSDLFRYADDHSVRALLRFFVIEPAFRYQYVMRSCQYLSSRRIFFPLLIVFRLWLRRLRYRFGISLSFRTKVGYGLYIGHFGGIVINSQAQIGNNCNISHSVTVGGAYRGRQQGYPIIGNNVFIGPGAVILGNIHVGDRAAIGANSVVVSDVPAGTVVAGSPATVVSSKGSEGLVNNTWSFGNCQSSI